MAEVEVTSVQTEISDFSGNRWAGDFHRLRLRLFALLICADAALMAVAFLAANFLRFGRPLESYGITTFALLWPIYLGIGLNSGAYSLAALQRPRRSAAIAAQALLFATAIATFLFFSLKIGDDFSRLVFGVGSLASLLFIVGGRVKFGKLIGARYDWTFRREVLLVDGVEAVQSGTVIVVDAEKEGLRPATDDPAMLERLARTLDRCERVILACPPERREAWSRMLTGANVDVEILAPELDQIGALDLRRYGQGTTLLIGCGPLGLRQRAFKRALDISVSMGALLVLLPLLICIAIAIRLDSPGPVLFRQMRVGRGNRLFQVLKFRTMHRQTSDPDGKCSTEREDPRVTRLGKLLRRTSLDELPQLVNVLKGEMSIVGPRPHALGSTAENDSFWAIDDRYWDRHAIKPGMTGSAQIRGFRGATVTRVDLTNRLHADLEYLDGWSIGRDLAIILGTIRVMVHKNAF